MHKSLFLKRKTTKTTKNQIDTQNHETEHTSTEKCQKHENILQNQLSCNYREKQQQSHFTKATI